MNEVVPLAFTMMIGPQIITSIILVTSHKPVRTSLSYVLGILLATTIGTLVFYYLARFFDFSVNKTGQPSQAALIIQTALVILLIIIAVKTYIGREKVMLPHWMQSLQHSTPKSAFKTAVMLIFLMPTDLIVMSTVGINLASHSSATYVRFIPFIVLTVIIAAAPLLTYLVFHKRAVTVMPKVRSWMETNSWVVTIVAYCFFLYLLWPQWGSA